MAIYKNVSSQKLAVFAYDSTTGAAKTGDAANITAQISLDGAATGATVNPPTELDATDAPGVYLFDMTQAETNANLIVLAAVSATSNILLDPLIIYTLPGSPTSFDNLAKSAGQIIQGTVDNTAHTPTTTEFEADDITEATADHYNGRIVIFTSGALAGQATDITDYALATGRGHFTVTALTEAPANNDTFVIV